MKRSNTLSPVRNFLVNRISHPLTSPVALLFSLIALLLLAILVINLEATPNSGRFSDSSSIEYMQEGLALLTSILFFMLAKARSELHGFAVLVAGFFVCILIRELDSFFDQIFHGFWKYPAWTMAISTIGYVIIKKAPTKLPLIDYTKHASFGLMLAGIVTLLVFSRLFGMGELWKKLMGELYLGSVKSFAEESIELLGYCQIFIASAWYYVSQSKKA